MQFTITADGTTAGKVFSGLPRGPVTATFSAQSANWEGAAITIKAQMNGGTNNLPIAGCEGVSGNLMIPVSIPSGATLTVVTAGKSGSTPINIEIF